MSVSTNVIVRLGVRGTNELAQELEATKWSVPVRMTDRQRDVWRMIALGLTNKEIAARLGLVENTVAKHREIVAQKLGAKNAADLTRAAVRFGIIRVEIL